MRLFKKLRRKLEAYLDDAQIAQIEQAYLLAFDAHKPQKRITGEPYITHPVAVACILADMKLDPESIMAALLHDVIEDTEFTKEQLAERFGDQVAQLVDGVSKLTQMESVSRAEMQAESFRKMVLAMAKDIRVIMVKLADRLHNMRTMESLRPEKRRRISKETLEIFAPIARRLGMRDFSVELEELGFSASYPRRYAILKDAVHRARGNRKKILSVIQKTMHDGLSESNLPTCVIVGREKHLYSIYRKMKQKRIPFNEIMDVYAFRIIVDEVDTCYRALGVVHSLFKPVPERFKDYIAIPKVNGYQSLHTTLFGPYGLPIEMQIRTTKMDRMATSGIAAHWIYKTKGSAVSDSQLRAQQWVKNLLELQRSTGSSLEFVESVKVDLFPDEVYVFTPKGNIMQLPGNATAIDFAYAVHTDIGNACVAVKVDRQLSPLSTSLKNGQTIEVITAQTARPSPSWLDFVVTSKARSGIRHYLKSQQKEESIALGQKLLAYALTDNGLSLKGLPDGVLEAYCKEAHLAGHDELFAEIGLAQRVAQIVVQRIKGLIAEGSSAVDSDQVAPQAPMMIKGTEGMLLEYSSCCHPIPGDPIVGVFNSGQGISVHLENCVRILKLHNHPERCMPLRWADDIQDEFHVMVIVEVRNERGVLAEMALAVSDAGANIEDISVTDQDGQHYLVTFKLLVHDRGHLARVLRRLRQVPPVTRIVRRR